MSSPSWTSTSSLMLASVRVACAEIVAEIGYAYAQDSVLDTMSEVVAKFITEVSLSAKSNAQLARRTDINLWDAANAIADLGMTLQVLLQFRKLSGDLPFNYDMLPFPQPRSIILCQPAPSNMVEAGPEQTEETFQNLPEIPSCLPALPAPHTYRFTPVFQKPSRDPNARRKLVIKQKRQVESSLVKLNRSLQQQQGPDSTKPKTS